MPLRRRWNTWAKIGDSKSAFTLLHQLNDPHFRGSALTAIAVAAAEKSDWKAAERYLEELENKRNRAKLLGDLAHVAAKENEMCRARRYLLEIPADSDLKVLLPTVARVDPSAILYLARQVIEARSTST